MQSRLSNLVQDNTDVIIPTVYGAFNAVGGVLTTLLPKEDQITARFVKAIVPHAIGNIVKFNLVEYKQDPIALKKYFSSELINNIVGGMCGTLSTLLIDSQAVNNMHLTEQDKTILKDLVFLAQYIYMATESKKQATVNIQYTNDYELQLPERKNIDLAINILASTLASMITIYSLPTLLQEKTSIEDYATTPFLGMTAGVIFGSVKESIKVGLYKLLDKCHTRTEEIQV